MNSKVILIVVLVVVGAIILLRMNKDDVGSDVNPDKKTWVSEDELTVAADFIVAELDVEAMEALPSDLRPNVDLLKLTEEGEAELFAILNSLADNGVLGLGASGPSLGAPPKQALLNEIKKLESRFEKDLARKLEVETEISNFPGPKGHSKRKQLEKTLKQIEDHMNRNVAKRRELQEKIDKLEAEAKGGTKKPDSTTSESSTQSIQWWETKKQELQKRHRELMTSVGELKKKLEGLEKDVKSKRISREEFLPQRETLQNSMRDQNKEIESIRRSVRRIDEKIGDENRRISAEKKENAKKAEDIEKADAAEKSAQQSAEESEAKASHVEINAKKESERNDRKVREAERDAKEAKMRETSTKQHNEQVLKGEATRLEYTRSQLENEMREIEREASRIKEEEDAINQKMVTVKAEIEAQRKKNNRTNRGRRINVNGAPKHIKKRLENGLEKAKMIQSKERRERAEKNFKKKFEDDMKRLEKYAEWVERTAVEEEEKLVAREKQHAEEYDRKMRDLGERKQKLERQRVEVQKKSDALRVKTTGVAEEKKQREVEEKKLAEEAHAAKMKQLELERQKVEAEARANAEIEKAKRDAAMKEEDAERKRVDKEKAEAKLRKAQEAQDKERREEKAAELERGIRKISGMTSDSINLSSLDNSVLLELKDFMEFAGGHRLLPAVIRMIELRRREKEQDEKDTGPSREEIIKNIERISGMPIEKLERQVHLLDIDVLEELREYSSSVGLKTSRSDEIIAMKKLLKIMTENGFPITFQQIQMVDTSGVDVKNIDIASIDAILNFLRSEEYFSGKEKRSRLGEAWLTGLNFLRGHKVAEAAAARKAAEAARAKKQEEQLEALEEARVAQAEKDRQEAADKLEKEKKQLAEEIVEVEKAVSERKQLVDAQSNAEIEKIEREHEEKKNAVAETVVKSGREREKELVKKSRDERERIQSEAEAKLEEAKQAHAEVEEEMRAEAIQAVMSIEAEISASDDPAVKSALSESLRLEIIARNKKLKATQESHAREQDKILMEAALLIKESERTLVSSLEQVKGETDAEIDTEVAIVEQQKQDLIEKREEIQEIDRETVEVEGNIRTEILEEKVRDAEEDKEMIEETTAEDVVEKTVTPRRSKSGRVTVTRKTNANGSMFVRMSVPSDLSPGESDEVSVFLEKEAVDLLAQYQTIHRNIQGKGSLDDLSDEDKAVLSSAGSQFRILRDQYVQQRKEKVLERKQELLSAM